MAFDFLLDQATNDLSFSNKDLQFTKEIRQEVGQRVGMKLRTFEGEWFLDTTYGIPYMQEIIAVARNKRDVDSIFISEIRNEAGVNNIKSFQSTFENINRKYEAKAVIITDEGEVEIISLRDPATQYKYPDPVGDANLSGCDLQFTVESVNELYRFINFTGLPAGKPSTWINNWRGSTSTYFRAGTSSAGDRLLSF